MQETLFLTEEELRDFTSSPTLRVQMRVLAEHKIPFTQVDGRLKVVRKSLLHRLDPHLFPVVNDSQESFTVVVP